MYTHQMATTSIVLHIIQKPNEWIYEKNDYDHKTLEQQPIDLVDANVC